MMKKVYCIVIMVVCMCVSYIGISASAFGFDDVKEFPYAEGNEEIAGTDAVDAGKIIKESSIDDDEGVVVQIMDAFCINYIDESQGQTATFYAKELINWLLVIIGLVALVSMLRGFYKMLLAKDSEEGYASAKKIVLNAALAIFIIGISWFLVSWFFAIYTATLTTTTPT